MSYEETFPQEEPKKKYTWLFFAIPIALIATCNVYINTKQKNDIMKSPEAGDFFVFRGIGGLGDLPFKLKEIKNDSFTFFIPKYGISKFSSKTSESKIYQLDKENKLFEPDYTITIHKATMDSLREDMDRRVSFAGFDNVKLEEVFGRGRGNAVESALETIAGDKKEKTSN